MKAMVTEYEALIASLRKQNKEDKVANRERASTQVIRTIDSFMPRLWRKQS